MVLTEGASLALLCGVALLVVWRLAVRARRMIGRQKLSRLRLWMTVLLFPPVVLVLLLVSLGQPAAPLSLLAGLGGGAGIGWLGLRLTRFERGAHDYFYTPNAWLGGAILLLLVARILYRIAQEITSGGVFGAAPDTFLRSPVTLALVGLLAGYYVAYALGLLRWRQREKSRRKDIARDG